jgi:two-component system sensor histidine kinase RegB
MVLFDLLQLGLMLFLSGGLHNPFYILMLGPVMVSAAVLSARSTVTLGLTAIALATILARAHLPLQTEQGMILRVPDLFLFGNWVAIVIAVVFLSLYARRVAVEMHAMSDALEATQMALLREQKLTDIGGVVAAAAHELGTPLASLSVILSDWRRMPALNRDEDVVQDIEQMQAEVERCKSIVTNILMSAGEARGEAPTVTTLKAFLQEIIAEWSDKSGEAMRVTLDGPAPGNPSIIVDPALKQVFSALLDNAHEAGARNLEVRAAADAGGLFIAFEDDGPGFSSAILEKLGQPYQSTKARAGSGLGLFLLVNVMRKLGGTVVAVNRPKGQGGAAGAMVRLTLPIDALAPK